ncbi:MAG: T9SS type A sorting domain-containing protein [Saprospiraceae bacterium]
MINIFQKHTFSLCLVLVLLVGHLDAQVFPGDVNDDGIVDNIDFLYVGTAFGEVGPPRDILEQGIGFEEKLIASLWGSTLSNGLDLAYADCDGNGFIDFNDLNAVIANIGFTHGIVMPETFPGGAFGQDPSITFDSTFIFGPFPEFAFVSIPISLGTEELPVQDFYGISFEVHYDPTIVFDNFIEFNFSASWLNTTGNDLHLSLENATTPGVLKVAATRTTPLVASVDNYGQIGTIQFIIEDDLLDYTQPALQTILEFQNVTILGGSGNPVPIVNDTITIEIIDNSVLSNEPELPNEAINIFPNPFKDQLNIRAVNDPIEAVHIYNVDGRLVGQFENIGQKEMVLSVDQFPKGIYFLKIQTSAGVRTEKVSKLE